MRKNYTFELKKQVVELYMERHTAIELAEKYEIADRRRIYEWVNKVKEAGTMDALKDTRGLANKGKTKEVKYSMEKEMERLKLENDYLKNIGTEKDVSDKESDFMFIDANKHRLSITELVKITSVSRSGYYHWKKTKTSRTKSPLNQTNAGMTNY